MSDNPKIEMEDAAFQDAVRWLALESDNDHEPEAIAALAMIGLEMVQRRREQLQARS